MALSSITGGVAGAAKLKFPNDWHVVGGFGLADVPLVGDLGVGRVEAHTSEQVRIAKATTVSAYEYCAPEAQLNKGRDLRLKGSQALKSIASESTPLSAEQSDNDRMEQEIADYEAKLCQCRITPDLRDWLRSK